MRSDCKSHTESQWFRWESATALSKTDTHTLHVQLGSVAAAVAEGTSPAVEVQKAVVMLAAAAEIAVADSVAVVEIAVTEVELGKPL